MTDNAVLRARVEVLRLQATLAAAASVACGRECLIHEAVIVLVAPELAARAALGDAGWRNALAAIGRGGGA